MVIQKRNRILTITLILARDYWSIGYVIWNKLSFHTEIRKIAFTGSGATGKKIMQAAGASNMKRVSLDLGGKSLTVMQ